MAIVYEIVTQSYGADICFLNSLNDLILNFKKLSFAG